jgi:hypothetical protein
MWFPQYFNMFDKTYSGNKINLTRLFAPGLTIGQILPRKAMRAFRRDMIFEMTLLLISIDYEAKR